MVRLVERLRRAAARTMRDPGREYRRLRLWLHLSPVFHPLPEGVGVFLYSGEMLSRSLLYDFEIAVRRLLRDVLKPGMTFIDAGANLGVYTAIAAKMVGPQGRVFAFEPSEREWQRARKTVRRNRLGNVELYRAALGCQDGTASLTVCEPAYGAFNTVGRLTHFCALGHDSHVENVTCRALDSFVSEKNLRQVDVIKIDVEGAEELVLRGGQKFFSAPDSPVIIFELSDWTAEGVGSSAAKVWELLSSYGYDLYSITAIDDGYRLQHCERRERIEYEDVVGLKAAHLGSLSGKLRIPDLPPAG